MSFGQNEKLVTRIKNVVDEYPASNHFNETLACVKTVAAKRSAGEDSVPGSTEISSSGRRKLRSSSRKWIPKPRQWEWPANIIVKLILVTKI